MSQPLVLPGSHTHSLPLELSPAVVLVVPVVVVLVPSSVVVTVVAVSVATVVVAVVVVASPVVEVVPPMEPWVVSPLVGVVVAPGVVAPGVVAPGVVAPEVVSPARGRRQIRRGALGVVVGVPPSSLQASGTARRSTRGRRGERVDM